MGSNYWGGYIPPIPPRFGTAAHTTTSMVINVIEDKRHVIFNCDLYAGLRTKLIARLNSAPEISSNNNNQNYNLPLIINELSLQLNITKLSSHNQWRNDRPCYPCYAGGRHLRGAAYYQTYSFLNEKSFDKVAKCTISRPT